MANNVENFKSLQITEKKSDEWGECADPGDSYFAEGLKKIMAHEEKEAYRLFYQGVLLNHDLCQKYYMEALATGCCGIEKNEDEAEKIYLTLAFKGDWDAICNYNEIDPNILKKNTVEEALEYYKSSGIEYK